VNATLACALVFGAVAAISGWFLGHHRPARVAAMLLVGGGCLVFVGTGAAIVELHQAAATLFRLGGCFLLPLSFVTFPVLRWRDPVSFVLLATTGAAGALCVLWPASFEPMAYVVGSCLLVHVWWSYERGGSQERRSLAWSALAWGLAALVMLFVAFTAEAVGSVDWSVGAVGIAAACVGPPAMVLGALRPEVVDVRGLVNRVVVAGSALAVFIAVASATTAVIESVRGRPLASTPTLVLCAFLAFGVRPLQVLLRGVVDRLLFGDRPDPLVAATSLADTIRDDPTLALDSIRETLLLPYACLKVGDTLLASSGIEVTHTRSLPLRLGEDQIGEFVVGLRPGDLGLSNADADVLRIVAPLLAQTLRAQAMSRDLQQSRESVVTAVEEERRRLRRDLHDGLGPTLTGVAFASDAAHNMVHADPDRTAELLSSMRADTTAAISEIRRLVEGLRPPALDQVGLLGSVRQYAETLQSADGSRLQVSVQATGELPALSAATEVAAYRIVVEALTNTARHAAALGAHVSLEVRDGTLVLSVRDDGRNESDWTPGVGLTSMRERSEQLGGTFRASASPSGGLVEATIPVGRLSDT
jgi:two-component system, NarL family, sensor kinase